MELLPWVAFIWMMGITIGITQIANNTAATKENSRKQLEFLDYIAELLEDELSEGKKKPLSNDQDKSTN